MRQFICAAAILAMVTSASFGTIVLNDNFDAYANGNLVGQGGWTQTGTSTVNPIQVSAGTVPLTTTGQDAYKAFSASVPKTAGTSMYTALDLKVTAAQATGDYFLHVSEPAGTTSGFYQRLFAKTSGSGFVLGISEYSNSPAYGTTVLNLNQTYRVVMAWNFIDGEKNDNFAVYVDATAPTEAQKYVGFNWVSTGSEPTQVSAANFRQGNSSNAPTVTVDKLAVATTFGEVVPEPAAVTLLALGSLLFARRRNA